MRSLTIRASLCSLSLLGLLLGHTDARAGEAWKPGQTYHGFELIRDQVIPEIGSRALIFEHKKSGARLMKLECKDDNKVFSIAFKTLPNGDHGIPHILEHSVLNGSEKYPVKSPFDILAKGSLNTFLNAFTSSDWTMYPVASRNKKDFRNLMDVYLDAVFHPRIYVEPKIFLQEGWRYHLESKDAELGYNGVVYNEMKGAFSSPERVLDYVVCKNLFPDTIYGYSSGGHPDAIPELSYETFLAFHRKYYHPENSYISLYGDGDTLAELAFIDEHYLSSYERTGARPRIGLQKPFEALREVRAEYPVAKSESTDDKTFLSLDFAAGGGAQAELTMALEILAEVLVALPAAPVRRALLEAGIGKDVYATYDNTKQGVFSIVVKNAEPRDKDRFKQVVFDTLRRVVEQGLDKRDIEGVLNRTEFSLREADYGSFPKGLVYGYIAQRSWMFADDPIRSLAYEKLLAATRQALTSRYLEELIAKHLLANPHALLTVVEPRPGLEDEHARKLEAKLAEVKASLSDRELEALVEQTRALKAYQARPDKPEDIAKIPMLTLADLDSRDEKLEVRERSVGGTRVLFFEHPTNGIIYLQLLFDARTVPQELIPHAKLLASLLGKLDTAERGYGELDTELNIHTGGVDFDLQTFLDVVDGKAYDPRLVASAKVLTPKLDKLVALLAEILTRTRFDRVQRLREVIGERNSELQSMARSSGHSLAISRLGSYLSEMGRYDELAGGLTQIQFVSRLAGRFDRDASDLIADLDMVAKLLFRRQGLIIGLCCSAEDYAAFEKQIPALLARMGEEKRAPQAYRFAAQGKNEGLLSASKVQYVARGANFRDLGYAFSGKLNVLRQILSQDYLYQKIRVQGGAYGAWSSFGRSGFALLSSYRDPHLEKTLQAYDGAVDYLKAFDASETEMTRFIIGTIAQRDRPKTPAQKARLATFFHLSKISHADRQKAREEILATRRDDIRAFAKLIEDVLAKSVICVYGNEEKLKADEKRFESLVKVIE
ncbi:MAG: insulinase family protein [Deltaproteobacteria bacterium]|nr:insulinase family protein [Deltaproteobacteria bacterium]